MRSLQSAHDRWRERHGRTTIGLSGLSLEDCGRYIGLVAARRRRRAHAKGFRSVLVLRFAVDDLKAYYLEAASAGIGKPSSRQLGDWFWNNTAAGAAIIALRAIGLASADERLNAILGNFMVPAARVALMS